MGQRTMAPDAAQPSAWPERECSMPDGSRMSTPNAASVFTLPNAISFARLCAVPLAVWLVLHQRLADAFWIFVAAGISDAVDGWLARRWGGSSVGAVLDPLADKALMIGMYVTLAVVKALPDWLAILVVFRDVVIVGGGTGAGGQWAAGGDPPAGDFQDEHGLADCPGRHHPVPVGL